MERSQAIYYQGLSHSAFRKLVKSKAGLSLMRDEWLQIKDNIICSSYFKYKHAAHVFGFLYQLLACKIYFLTKKA